MSDALSRVRNEINLFKSQGDEFTETHFGRDLESLCDEIELLRREIDGYKWEVQPLRDENQRLQARVAELVTIGNDILYTTIEEPWDKYAKVPRGFIRDLEKALQETDYGT